MGHKLVVFAIQISFYLSFRCGQSTNVFLVARSFWCCVGCEQDHWEGSNQEPWFDSMIGSTNPDYQSSLKEIHLREFLRICFPVWFFEHFLVTAKMTIWIRKWLILFIIREWHCNFLILWVIIIFMHIKLLLHYNQKHLKVFVLLALNVLYYWGDKSDHFIVNNSPPFDECNQILQLNRTKPSPISECCVLFHFFDTIEHSFGSLSINVTPFFFFLRGGPATLCFFIN